MRAVVSVISLLALASAVSFSAEDAGATEDKKRSFLRRMTNIFSKEKKESPPEEKKAEEKKAPAPKPKASEAPPKKKPTEAPPKPTLRSTQKAPAPKPKPKPVSSDSARPSKPKVADKPETKSEPPKKPEASSDQPKETVKKTPTPKPESSAKPDEPKKETVASDGKKQDKSADPKASDDAKPSADTAKADEAKGDAKPSSMKPGSGEFDDISAAFGTGTKPETPPSKTTTDKPPAEISTTNLPPPPPLPNSDGSWEIVKLNGHDYVTADSIQRFYRFNALKLDGKHVWMRSPIYIVKADIGSQELLINNTKFILNDSVAESKGKALFSRLDLVKLIDPVLLPNHIQTAEVFDTVVVDAGHGGHDSGAKGIYGYEKDFTLKMALAVSAALQARGFKTVLTRRTDEFITLPGRVEIANATPRSIFISLHFNSSGPSAAGIETWALSPQGTASTFMGTRGWDGTSFSGNRRDSENIALATAIHAMVIHNLSALAEKGMMDRNMVDRGIKRARWSVLTGCNRPGILFEGGFVTNATEGRLIAAQSYREYLSKSIADAVVNYRKALYPNVAQPSVKR